MDKDTAANLLAILKKHGLYELGTGADDRVAIYLCAVDLLPYLRKDVVACLDAARQAGEASQDGEDALRYAHERLTDALDLVALLRSVRGVRRRWGLHAPQAPRQLPVLERVADCIEFAWVTLPDVHDYCDDPDDCAHCAHRREVDRELEVAETYVEELLAAHRPRRSPRQQLLSAYRRLPRKRVRSRCHTTWRSGPSRRLPLSWRRARPRR